MTLRSDVATAERLALRWAQAGGLLDDDPRTTRVMGQLLVALADGAELADLEAVVDAHADGESIPDAALTAATRASWPVWVLDGP